ncbi:hypothetical protein C479_02591 [Halovivax asiaticus JCM 14624]|uniref:Thioredoxin domain-containing protein n=1 Tax=Halovivax asiaticus JCM 14624 TaxID=1227490 RepID=M0BU99_9EURY|nr:DUF255 domain-containing protein [Halovivax asiaticus]ELZ13697.1 hypothetical protein C479_02591 [Halovivax asiaticus JCM 14624]
MADEMLVEWNDWEADAFATARANDAPILLSITASWCRPCDEMDAETYADPRIAAAIGDDFVPVRVDADRHPRVRDRYNSGGFPSTVVLTPDGEVIAGAGYLDSDGMRQVLTRVRERWDEDGRDAGRIPRALETTDTPAGALESTIVSQMMGALQTAADDRAGGWGDAPKFPYPAALEFALKRDIDQARRAFDAVGTNLLDDYDGGFYRFATERDWSGLQHEKLLDENAALVRAFANAYLHTGEDSYRTIAERGIEYLTTTLWRPQAETTDGAVNGTRDETAGAFAGSQAPGDPAQYVQDATGRERADDPPVDETIYTGKNALAIDALLTYAAYTDDERATRYADRALQTIRTSGVTDGVVDHVIDDTAGTGPTCTLVDQTRVLRALVTARSVVGTDTVADAQAVADETIARLRDGDSFVDGPTEGPGLLSRPLRPLSVTAEFADALLDLALLTGEDRYRTIGRSALEAFAGASDRLGVGAAAYGTAVARYLDEPLVIRVGTDPGSDLHRAAMRIADHEKLVVPNATDVDPDTAVVSRGTNTAEPATDPESLGTRVTAVLDGDGSD